MVSTTRSARDTLSKKTPQTTPIAGSRKSERLEKKTSTPPSMAAPVNVSSEKNNKNEKSTGVLVTPLRRSDRMNKSSESSLKKKRKIVEEKEVSEEEECDFGRSSTVKKRLNGLVYRAGLCKADGDYLEETNKMDKSTQEGANSAGGKIPEDMLPSEDAKAKEATAESKLIAPVDKLLEDNVSNDIHNETSRTLEMDQSDCCGQETSHMLRADSGLNEPVKEISENNATLDCLKESNKMDKSTQEGANSCGGKIPEDMLPSEDAKAKEATAESKLIEPVNELLEENVYNDIHNETSQTLEMDQSDCCGQKTSHMLRAESGLNEHVKEISENNATIERPQQGNDVELIRKQQRSLHLSLKPKIAKLCEILRLPDNVKNMVDNCLEYIMNNRQICTEPVTILQAFQLSLCWIAASLLQYKLDFEASVKLAKWHLNFTCKKHVVNEIFTRLWELKEEILSHAGNPVVTNSPKVSESSYKVYSCTEVPPDVELTNSKSTKEIQKCETENQLEKVLRMQRGEMQKLKVDIEKEKADFWIRYQVQWAAIQHCSPSDPIRRERLEFFNNEYGKKLEELKRQHETRFKDLKALQVETMWKYEESREQGEFIIPDASKKLETGIEDLQTCDQAQPQNGPKNMAHGSDHVAEGKSFDNIVEGMTRAGTGVGLSKSPDTNSPVVVLCSSPVELQTPPGKHAAAIEMGTLASENETASRNKCHSISENEYESQGNIIPKHSNSREICFGLAANATDEAEGCGTFSCESHNDSGQETPAVVLLSSNREICDRGTSDVPNGKAALLMSKTSISNDDQEVPSSSQGKLDQTILRKPDCGLSVEVKEGFRDGVKNKASLNSYSSVGHIPNCEKAAQSHEVENNYSNNGETPKLSSYDERPCGGATNHSVLGKELPRPCGIASPNDGSDANATTTLNQDPLEKQNPDAVSSSIPAEQIIVEVPENGHEGALVSVSEDRELPSGTHSTVSCHDQSRNVTPLDLSSMDQISDGGPVLDGNSSSRSGGMLSSPSNGLAIAPLNPPPLQQPDRVSLSIPANQIPDIVPETSHEVQRTMPENTSTQEAPLSRPAGQTEPPEHVHPLSAVQSPDESDTVRETQNSLVSGPVDIVPANQSNLVSLVVEPPVQVQQLTCEDISSNPDLPSLPSATGIEHQQTNENAHSSHIAEASIKVPNQATEQRTSNLESDSQSNINNQPIQTATQSASRNAPPLFHGDPLKNEMEKIRKLANDNLKNHEDKKLQFKSDFEKELEELRKKYEVKLHDTEAEFQQQRKELDTQFKTVFASIALADAFRYKCLNHKISSTSGMHQDSSFAQQLDQIFSQQLSTWPPPVSGSSSSGPRAASMQSSYTTSPQTVVPPPPQPYMTSSSQTMVLPPLRHHRTSRSQPVIPPPPRPYTTSSSQSMVPPPPQPTYNTSANFSSVSARLPHNNSILSLSRNFQAGGDIRSPAPHLQPYRPPMAAPLPTNSPAPHLQPRRPSNSLPASTNLSTAPTGMPSRPASSNISLNPPFSRQHPSLLSRPNQSDPHKGPQPTNSSLLATPSFPRHHHSVLLRPNQSDPPKGPQPTSADLLPTPNLTGLDSRMDANIQSGVNPPNILPRLSDLEKLNLPRVGISSSGPANSPHQGISSDMVFLSDDD